MKTCFTYDDLFLFLNKVSIYRSGYNILVNKTWIHSKKYLNNDLLLRAINSGRKTKVDIAFSSCYMTNFFVLDVDFHQDYGKDYFMKKNHYLTVTYDRIKDVFGEASMAVSTPRGLHLYFFLKEKISVDTLHNLINTKLIKNNLKNIDIKPGIDSYIRCFAKSKLLRTKDLSIYSKATKFSTILNRGITYNLGELFPVENRAKVQFISEKKKDYSVIFAGETNDALNYLIPLWKNHGLSDEECTANFIARLSPSYSGECKSFEHVFKRVKCYDKISNKKVSVNSFDEIYLKNKKIIDFAINLSNYAIKKNSYNRAIRAENVKKLMCLILSTQENINNIKNDKRLLFKYCSENPFFFKETKANRIPIPSVYLRFYIQNYEPILNFLKAINFISSQSSYSVNKHSCIYYGINIEFYKKYLINKEYKLLNIRSSFLQEPFICSKMFLVLPLRRVRKLIADTS